MTNRQIAEGGVMPKYTSVYEKILAADQRGTGVWLTPKEVAMLADDDALIQAAEERAKEE